MIISGGVNIYPQEAENLLVTHPKVADVAVFGVPNPDLGEEVKAVVQPIDMADAGPQLERELIEFCQRELAKFKCPRSIDFEAELPRLASKAGSRSTTRPALLGTRCNACGTYFFPKERASAATRGAPARSSRKCRSRRAASSGPSRTTAMRRPRRSLARGSLRAVRGRGGRARAREDGRARAGRGGCRVSNLHVGMEMELTLDTLYQDGENDVVTWKWRPA